MQILLSFLIILMLGMGGSLSAYAADRPLVVELFTSQGCASCPAADKILREFAESDPSILPLSFHVNYWDHLGWKDPYAAPANTSRQRNYAQLQGRRNIFTPQVVVDGVHSAIGNDHEAVNRAIRLARNTRPTVPIAIAPDKHGYDLIISVGAKQDGPTSTPAGAIVWVVYFSRHNLTPVDSGENSGKTLVNINSVIAMKRLGFWHSNAVDYHLSKKELFGDGFAVILQSSPQNEILGAATYYDYES